MNKPTILMRIVITVLVCLLIASVTQAQGPVDKQGNTTGTTVEPLSPEAQIGTSFTYQGYLEKDGSPVNDQCDFDFSVWDASANGNQIGSILQHFNVTVTDGKFARELNTSGALGAYPFNGKALYLNIAVRCPAGAGSYVTLAGRQKLTAAPYAHSLIPGAVISNTASAPALNLWTNSGTALVVKSLGGGSGSYGIHATTSQTDGTGVYGEALGGPEAYGVWGRSDVGRGVVGGSDSGIGVYGWTSGGVDVMAGGTGVISSTADTTLYLSPFTAMRRDSFTDLTFTPLDNGGVRIKKVGTGTGERLVVIPISTGGVVFGAPVYVKSLEVCYKTSAAAGYITGSGSYKGNGETYATYLSSSTDYNSTTRACYTINASSRAVIDNSSYVQLHLYFTNSTEPEITIFTVKVNLSEMSQ